METKVKKLSHQKEKGSCGDRGTTQNNIIDHHKQHENAPKNKVKHNPKHKHTTVYQPQKISHHPH